MCTLYRELNKKTTRDVPLYHSDEVQDHLVGFSISPLEIYNVDNANFSTSNEEEILHLVLVWYMTL